MRDKFKIFKRKEPVQERARATVDAILAAAAQFLEKYGLDSSTTNQIAERAGVSIGTLYQYFPNKETLAAALIDRHVEGRAEKLRQDMQALRHLPLHEALAAAVEGHVDAFLGKRGLLQVLGHLIPRMNLIPSVLRVRDGAVRLVADELRARAGEVDVADPELAAFVVINAVMGVFQTIIYDPTREVGREELSRELALLVEGYLLGAAGGRSPGSN